MKFSFIVLGTEEKLELGDKLAKLKLLNVTEPTI